jgi:hemerythrin-like domain-containing protein
MNMTNLLDRNIKDVIVETPAVGDILKSFNIACVTCNVGTCKLKDVVSVHSMSVEQEQDLFLKIAQAVFPGQKMELPRLERKAPVSGKSRQMSPPLVELVAEHIYIKRVIALIPALTTGQGPVLKDTQKQTLLEVLDFIRNFADRFHHAKEEDILFKYFDETSDIISSMHKEHEIGREHIRAVAVAIEKGDTASIIEHLSAYGVLLSEHIRKEDEILYPWMDGQLADAQVGRMFSQFRDVNERFGDKPGNYQRWVDELENRTRREER